MCGPWERVEREMFMGGLQSVLRAVHFFLVRLDAWCWFIRGVNVSSITLTLPPRQYFSGSREADG